ncbi:MAG: NAD(P)/FAD-dependent oxidoreductase [Gemmatimonadaceae bacterium]
MTESFDLVVVGTGAGGSGPAYACRAAGWHVAVVDDQPFGGTCEVRGCDPKKVLVGAADVIDWHRRMTGHGVTGDAVIDWPALMRFKRTFTDPVPAKHEAAFEKAGVVTYHGSARFTSETRMIVTAADERSRAHGVEREVESKHFVIASGAEPAPLGIPGDEHVRTSTDFLELDSLPQRIVFIGAGYISFEFAHIAQRAGAQAIVLGRGAPLGHFDQDLVTHLVAHSRNLGIDIRTDANVASVEKMAKGYRVHFSSNAGPQVIDADLVVHGAGRIPKTKQLELNQTNVTTDKRGSVVVNEFMQSVSNARVYAAGDCALPPGSMPLTPVAAHEGIIVASNLLHGNSKKPDYRGIPSVAFTIPPLAAVGLTEAEARKQGLDVRVKCEDTATWFSNRRMRESATMFKTVVENGTDHVLGAHLLGPDAPDVINVFALAVRHGITAADLKHMIYAYPTSTSDVGYML